MASYNISCMVFAFFIAGVVLLSGNLAWAEECHDDLDMLLETCKQYVLIRGPHVQPSKECCTAIQQASIPCVCKYVTPDTEKIFSMPKVVEVVKYCHRPFAHGYKCGSYKVPNGMILQGEREE